MWQDTMIQSPHTCAYNYQINSFHAAKAASKSFAK
jgi:hypothetical protein